MPARKQNLPPSTSPQAMAKRVQRLNQVVTALQTRSETYFSITRLTIIKGLCATHTAALEFVLFLTKHTREKMRTSKPSKELALSKPEQYMSLANQAVKIIGECLKATTCDNQMRAYQFYVTVQGTQNKIVYPMGKYPIRVIHSKELLLIENALLTTAMPESAPDWAYQTARVYAERYNSRYGTGLIPESLPMVKEIVEFWQKYYHLPVVAQIGESVGAKRNRAEMHQDSARVKDSRRNRKPINRRQALPELLANLSQEDLGALVTELVQQQPELDDRIRTALARPPAVQKQRRKRPNH